MNDDSHLHNSNLTLPDDPLKIANDFLLQYYSVRQFYPESLYRFYRDDSCLTFTENNEDKTFIGRSNIKHLFDNIGYRDCRSTVLAHSVQYVSIDIILILLSGEISNCGRAPRRNCEVFTLHKSCVDCFYVKNHIIHFQDDSEDERMLPDFVACREQVSEENSPPLIEQEPGVSLESCEFQHGNTEDFVSDEEHRTSFKDNFDMPTQQEALHLETVKESWDQSPLEASQSIPKQLHNLDKTSSSHADPHQQQSTEVFSDIANIEGAVMDKTWANIAKSGDICHIVAKNSQLGFVSVHGSQTNQQFKSNAIKNQSTLKESRMDNADQRVFQNKAISSTAPDTTQYKQKSHANVSGEDGRLPADGGSSLAQVFVGNIPLDCTEDELYEIFGEFGMVVEFHFFQSRTKSNRNVNVPNCGYVRMESANACSILLNTKPFLIRGGHELKIQPYVPRPSLSRNRK